MASTFNVEDICEGDHCEGDHCEAITDVTYYVKEKKKLCDACASKEGCFDERRRGRPSLCCEKHGEEIKLYCKTHKVALCYSCALIDHHNQSCVRQDIRDAITENKARLYTLKEKAMDKLQVCQGYRDQMFRCRTDSEKHLQVIKDQVDSVINEMMELDKDNEQKDADKINQEIDGRNQKLEEKIQKIKEKMEKNNTERKELLKLNHIQAEKRRLPLETNQCELNTDIQTISGVINKKFVELEKSWKGYIETVQNAVQALDTALKDCRDLVENGHRLYISVTDEIAKPLDEDGLKHISHTVSGIRFVKGARRKKYNGRIDGYDGEWVVTDTINVKDKVQYPTIVGCINGSNVIITDVESHNTYILNTETRQIQKVITGSEFSSIVSCALVDGEQIACGKLYQSGDNAPVSLYDHQWKFVKDVTIPRHTKDSPTWVYVSADQEGMIVAAESGQPNIHVIHPADGKIINTISFKEDITLRDVMSSGRIIAQPLTRDNTLIIVDRDGAQTEFHHSDVILDVCIDPLTDALYVATLDDEQMTCVVDQVLGGGNVKKKTVALLPISTRSWVRTHLFTCSRVMMTSSGKILASDGDNILVLEKIFSL